MNKSTTPVLINIAQVVTVSDQTEEHLASSVSPLHKKDKTDHKAHMCNGTRTTGPTLTKLTTWQWS